MTSSTTSGPCSRAAADSSTARQACWPASASSTPGSGGVTSPRHWSRPAEGVAVDATITRLAEFATGLRYEQLPSGVVDLAVGRLVDALGCAVGGMDSEQARIALAVSPSVCVEPDGEIEFTG